MRLRSSPRRTRSRQSTCRWSNSQEGGNSAVPNCDLPHAIRAGSERIPRVQFERAFSMAANIMITAINTRPNPFMFWVLSSPSARCSSRRCGLTAHTYSSSIRAYPYVRITYTLYYSPPTALDNIMSQQELGRAPRSEPVRLVSITTQST